MKKLLGNKNILVTGTARGIGYSMVEIFAAHGANIIAHARKESLEHKEFCEEISQKEDVKIIPMYFDLADQN